MPHVMRAYDFLRANPWLSASVALIVSCWVVLIVLFHDQGNARIVRIRVENGLETQQVYCRINSFGSVTETRQVIRADGSKSC